MADVDLNRIVFYIYPSREIYFLCKCPFGMEKYTPWEVSFTPAHGPDPNLWQLHFEFTDNAVLPLWYAQRRSCKVKKVTVVPIQGREASPNSRPLD